ncbi:MAG TPA: hypothetical protein PLD59_11750, partial [Tepidisphaeraceae bacterium]|nr:hypothetical protein [Tepidisphaeraceae bacterium]
AIVPRGTIYVFLSAVRVRGGRWMSRRAHPKPHGPGPPQRPQPGADAGAALSFPTAAKTLIVRAVC